MKSNSLRRILRTAFIAVLIFSAVSCASVKENQQTAAAPIRKIKTAYFVDDGSRSAGVFHIARLLKYSPDLDVTLVDGKDIRDGKLAEFEMLVVPGGSSQAQFMAMQEEGAAAIRKFVEKGGHYVGICAGFHCALTRKERISLLPFTYIGKKVGRQAALIAEINQRGAKLMDIPAGRYRVHYSYGPISEAIPANEKMQGEVLGTFLNSVTNVKPERYDFTGAPSMIYGNYGKGKVIASSFHPEYLTGSHVIFYGMLYAVTGVKIQPEYPQKNRRPLRVQMYTIINRSSVLDMLELDKHPELDVRYEQLNDNLPHTDVLVFPEVKTEYWKKIQSRIYETHLKKHKKTMLDFMDRGGIIILPETDLKHIQAHKNLRSYPTGSSLLQAVLKEL